MGPIKLFASYVFSLAARGILSPLKLLPVNKRRVLFVSFRGKQYSCSPKAISEELEKADRGLELVWAFHEPERFAFLKERGIKVVGDRSLKFLYYALTSRVVCTNAYYKPFLPRRKSQFYLRTWHGGGAYKRVNYPKGLYGAYIKLQQQGASVYLSSSKAFTRMTLRDSFGFSGEVIEKGLPRNDLLVSGKWLKTGEDVKKELGFAGKKLCLYAPTYRDGGRPFPAPDADRLRAALEKRFGGQWVLCCRGHHVNDASNAFRADKDLSAYGDMQPLLMAADVLVTDYSSSIWDMSLTGKPAFLYCPDLKEYKSERDFYTDIRSWPFPLSQSDEELEKNVLSFDAEKYAEDVKRHHEKLGSAESGNAAGFAAQRILKECGLE